MVLISLRIQVAVLLAKLKIRSRLLNRPPERYVKLSTQTNPPQALSNLRLAAIQMYHYTNRNGVYPAIRSVVIL